MELHFQMQSQLHSHAAPSTFHETATLQLGSTRITLNTKTPLQLHYNELTLNMQIHLAGPVCYIRVTNGSLYI